MGRPGAMMASRGTRWVLVASLGLAASLFVGCSGAPGADNAVLTASPADATVRPSEPAATPVVPVDDSIPAISASNPDKEAVEVLAKCNIGEQVPIDKVTGMGKVAAAADLRRYVPLTGREPQLKEDGPAWVVTIQADLPQPGSTELWSNPTCVVTDAESGYFATGLVTDLATGEVFIPERPAQQPEVRVPPLAP